LLSRSADLLSSIAGSLLSLLCAYAPGLADWYGRLDPTEKRLVMLVLLALVASGSFALACSSWAAGWGITLTCDQAGLSGLVRALFLAITTNQATYLIASSAANHRKEA
jgi:hypothetical protein